MNINCLNLISHKYNTNFGNNYSRDENQQVIAEIKSALETISKSDEYSADIGTIAKLSNLSEKEIYNCLFDTQNYELYDIWRKTLRENARAKELQLSQVKKKTINNPSSQQEAQENTSKNSEAIKASDATVRFIENKPLNLTERIIAEDKQIKSAMYQILNNAELSADIETLAQITDFPQQKITSRIYSPANNLYNFWQYVQAVKEDDSPNRRKSLMRFYRVEDRTYTYIKTKNPKVALNMIKQAVRNKSKISYQTIENMSGLDKNEIDALIYNYAKSLQEQARLVQLNKELQAKWYEENAGMI